MKIKFRKLSSAFLFLIALSSIGFSPLVNSKTQTSVSTSSDIQINLERNWILQPQLAYELIEQGALVLDAREGDLKKKDPLAGASSLVWQDLAEPELPSKGNLLKDQNELNKRLQALGVSADRKIIVLGDPLNGWGEDGRIAWALRTWGHNATFIVDGGLEAVRKQGPLNIQAANQGDFVAAPNSKWEIKKEELKDLINQDGVVVLDVREQREFDGKTPYGESRGGHVPGAKHLWYKDLIGKDGKLLPQGEIKKILVANGINEDTQVVSYCTGGIRAGWLTTVLNDLGYNARNYAGSMWEWSSQPASDYPLVKN